MKHSDMVSIGNLYGGILNSVKRNIRESVKKNPSAFEDEMELVGKGPNVDGYNKALNDTENVYKGKEEDEQEVKPTKRQETTQKMKDRLKDPHLSEDEKKKLKKEIDDRTAEEAEETEKLKESRKIGKKMLNSFMSNKSVFDKLYSKVLKENFGVDDKETDALGLGDATPDSDLGDVDEGGDEFGDEDTGDTVTVTLDRTTAQALVDVLKAALGDEGEDFGDEDTGGEDLDFGDEDTGGEEGGGEEEEQDLSFEEDEEVGTKKAPDKKTAYMGKDNKVSGPPKPKSTHANPNVTDNTNTTTGAPPITALQGKNNQVPGSKVKVGDYFK